MSSNKRKRRPSEKHELQLPKERRQQIKNLFEKKFAYRSPSDGSWTLPKGTCSLETSEQVTVEKKNKFSYESVHGTTLDQSDSERQSHDTKMDQSEEFQESCDTNMDHIHVPIADQTCITLKVLNKLWTVTEFIKMKNELNELKNNLNDKDMISWHQHTRSVNLASNIATEIQQNFRPELCTQAWCKFYEIVSVYLSLLEKESIFSVHLCEAPGAFVTSLNHFMLSVGYECDWDWIATTLNPYYEGNDMGHMISDDRFIRHTGGNWYFGVDNTGDLMSLRNLDGLKKLIGDRRVDLVTADGSIDCQGDPAEQEDVVSRLQHCESLAALEILSPGGDFVLKMFTMLECKAVCLMYLLNCVFEKVHVFKPCTSKGGNSEVYIVCQQFKGMMDPEYFRNLSSVYFGRSEPAGCLFSKHQIPSSFLIQHTECTSFFKELQMASIQRNLDLYKEHSEQEKQTLETEKQFCSECFFQRHYIVPMLHQWRIMKYKKKPQNQGRSAVRVSTFEKIASSRKNEGRFCGSFEDRLVQSVLPWKQKVMEYEIYKISETESVIWAENSHGPLTACDIARFHSVYGQPVDKIESSRFCYGRLIQQTQEIIQNIKWLVDEREMNKEMIERKTKKLLSILADVSSALTGEPRAKEQNGNQNQTDTDYGTQSAGYIDNIENVSVSVHGLIKNQAAEKSPLFVDLEKQLRKPVIPSTITVPEVQLYSVCADTLDEKFELSEQTDLLTTTSNILQTCHSGSSVIIEMRSCLTRVNAGLVFLLYRCFNKVAFFSYHGDLMRHYLVCLHFNLSQSARETVRSHKGLFPAHDNKAEFSLLEIVPVSILIDDPEFCSFLQSSNTRLLQSFVTTVVEKERICLSEKTDLT